MAAVEAGAAVPDRPVIVVADGAFRDRVRLVQHFGSVEVRFGDVSDPGTLGEVTAGASGVVVALQPLRAPHIAALAPVARAALPELF